MSAPQLTDPNSSSERFRKVSESVVDAPQRLPSEAAITTADAEPRRKRFVRLVTYMMAGLLAFTGLGVACFAWRQRVLQRELATPFLAAAQLPPPAPRQALAPVEPEAPVPHAPAAPVLAAAAVTRPTAKLPSTKAKKAARSVFSGRTKSTASKR